MNAQGTTGCQDLYVYISSTFAEMRQERELLAESLFPFLRNLCQERGVNLTLVDPRWCQADESAAESRALTTCLEEFRQYHPVFIGLLADRYGWVPDDIPHELLSQESWLSEQSDASVTEIEILHGVLRPPSLCSRAFFYFRDPQYVRRQGSVTEEAASAEKLRKLKDRIRASGLPVREHYSDLETLNLWILRDMLTVVPSLCPASASIRRQATLMAVVSSDHGRTPSVHQVEPVDRPRDRAAAPLDENAQFTVYRPAVVQPKKWYPLLAFAHLSERRPDASQDEPDPIEEVRRQAEQVLGMLATQYRDIKVDSPQALPKAGEITFTPEIPGIEFNPPSRTFRWVESVHREEFRLIAEGRIDGQTAKGRLTVFLGGIILADLPLSIRVDSRSAPSPHRVPTVHDSRGAYRNIFASYSRQDAWVLDQLERNALAVGDRYLRDTRDLRSGEVWSERLEQFIRTAEVFQLFWSSNSMRSVFVRREWEFALGLRREGFVRPTYWEDPLPNAPDEGLPPDELRRLHFQRIHVYEAPPPRSGRRVPPSDWRRSKPEDGSREESDATGSAEGREGPHPLQSPKALCPERTWFYMQAGRQHGPLSYDDICDAAEQRRLRPTDRVWRTEADPLEKGSTGEPMERVVRGIVERRLQPILLRASHQLGQMLRAVGYGEFRGRFDPMLAEASQVVETVVQELGFSREVIPRVYFDQLCELFLIGLNHVDYREQRERALLYSMLTTRALLRWPLSRQMAGTLTSSLSTDRVYLYGEFSIPDDVDPTMCWFLPGEEASPEASLLLPVYRITRVTVAQLTWAARHVLVPRSLRAAGIHGALHSEARPWWRLWTSRKARGTLAAAEGTNQHEHLLDVAKAESAQYEFPAYKDAMARGYQAGESPSESEARRLMRKECDTLLASLDTVEREMLTAALEREPTRQAHILAEFIASRTKV